MDGVTLIARLVLAAIFAVSGVAKLLTRVRARVVVAGFGEVLCLACGAVSGGPMKGQEDRA